MWILILQFIISFPAFFKTVKEIIELIRGLSDGEKVVYEGKLRDALRKSTKEKVPAAADLEALRQTLNYKKVL